MADNSKDSGSNPISNLSNLALVEDKEAAGGEGGQNKEEQYDYKYALTSRDLYGGAMKISIPTKWRDVSDIRQVPDHQEVYQDCTFAHQNPEREIVQEGTGGCLVIEILERQDEVSDEEAPSFFFHDLADANKSDDIRGGESACSRDAVSPPIEYSNVWTVGIEGNSIDATRREEKQERKKDKNLMPKLSAQVKACSCVGIQNVGPMRNRIEVEAGKASQIRLELCVVRLEVVQTDLLISLSMPLFPGGTKMGGVLRKKKNKCHDRHSELFQSILESFEVVDWSLFA
mmetsp:Transcript_25847/g.38714  ORF Transcript_25847/g.38714 Transcript_25847/m.38714 type:complete len:287 (+) Transcript_25847:132-992(+)|eukprot:CAMPEP_0203667396 /NCGR_PEP_ID=MMETSP0090-20130426/4235_1 /ASSEMBLY_ACC=CAM_ASM_001088 /TAXON_ID=426623 /ORGANISM="Chaetoceros affinis, Strain CCMP159" /LENGTH=286 /DNA_ID=CAMNT_0050531545 /DNA_START=48 /DNA_END=908 /DNA_ORIENTATION=+